MHKTCTGIKKTKKNKTLSIYSGLGVYRLRVFGFFGFFDACAGFVKIMLWFFWFFWCLCRFCEDHALVFLFFLMPVQVWWRLKSQNLHRHQKNQKNQTTRCTKPAQASKKPKKPKLWASTQGWGSIDYIFCFFLVFLMPVQVLCI